MLNKLLNDRGPLYSLPLFTNTPVCPKNHASMRSHQVRRLRRLAAASFAAAALGAAELPSIPADAAAAGTRSSPGDALPPAGALALRWQPTEAPVFILRPPAADLTSGGTLLLWIHASQASGDLLTISVTTRSQNPPRAEAASVSATMRISWTGWQEVQLPRRAFALGPEKRPPNWREVQQIELSFPAGSAANLVLQFGPVRVGDPAGPRLSDRELIALVDLSHPDLAAVRHAADTGDDAAAVKALAAYYRQRRSVPWGFDPHHRDPASVQPNLPRIDAMVTDDLTMTYRRFPFRGGVADWQINPTAGRSNQTDEWLWSLNRMDYWQDFGDAWWKTGDAKHVKVFVHQLRSWVQATPRPDIMDEAPGSGWRGLEAGLRAGESWPQAWHRFLSAPEFTDADLILMLKGFVDHGRHLAAHRVPNPALPSTNHYLIAWSGLYTVGLLFPELKPAAEWREAGRTRLIAAFQSSLFADGSWYEFAPGYHRWVLDKAVAAYRLAQLLGDEPRFPRTYLPMVQHGYEWLVKLMAPDRTFPKVNDTSSSEHLTFKPELAQLFPESPLLQWAVSLGQPQPPRGAPAPPPWRSVLLENSGYAVMRTGWSKADHYACFDVGPLGGWHGHQDKLSLLVWAHGREVLFDGGGGTYDRSGFRKYAQQTESHSTVMVDGLNQNRSYFPDVDPVGFDDPATPAPAFVTQPDWDYARGWFIGGYGPERKRLATHRREVAMLRGELFIVVDTLTPSDAAAHTYEARWQLKTTQWRHEKAIAGTLTADQGKANLLIVPLATAGLQVREDSGVKQPKLLGWDVERDRDPAPALTVRHTRTGSGVQRFATLLVPLAAGEKHPVQAVRLAGDTRWTIAFADGRAIQLALGPEAGGGFRVVVDAPSGERREFAIGAR